MSDHSGNPANGSLAKRGGVLARFLYQLVFGLILPVCVLGAGVWVSWRLLQSPPEAEQEPRPRQARLVDVVTVQAEDHRVIVEAMGTAMAARTVTLRPRVTGEVMFLDPECEQGGYFEAGELIARIDPSDYKIQMRQRKAELARVESAFRIEMGLQKVAQEELELLGESVDDEDAEWVLRKPQLESAEANLEVMRAELEMAELDLERTSIHVPFNALVTDRMIELGTQVGTGSDLVRLAGTDLFHIELFVPLDDLRWIVQPGEPGGTGAAVRLYDESSWGADVFRTGHVLRLTGSVDEQSRMARLLVSVEDPLCRLEENADEARLLLNSYVRGHIDGRIVPSSIAINPEYLHEGDRVWVMDENDQLDVRTVVPVYRGRDRILIGEGLSSGERVVITPLRSPVSRMALRTDDTASEADSAPGSDES